MTVEQVTILIPTWQEEEALPATIANIATMDPPPDEVLLVDGGSDDATVQLAKQAGFRAIIAPEKGRGPQINHGVEQAKGPIILILHADSILPPDAIAHVRQTLSNHKISLGTFLPIIRGKKTRWGTTLHNWIKTWYPIVTHPHLFVRGVRLLFGDHAMFFRREDFLAIGGIPDDATIMEEADLCIGMATRGKLNMTRKPVITSDRRIAHWGPLKANYLYLKIGIMWSFGVRKKLEDIYPDVR
ncbi:glycosyltransferase [Alterisphingorhabdus coralli]|uniref:Glycosyltransferase n=1 Tax=Alterisphingorhabdus coralli TaxID=3071408 RepID=A0AA97I0S2_9SPHN|nr:glycosyltransferase [Parasphingorhabdus sp. SCSIO 66989]WOE74628.1 glycosyltransferase [Parasphingorhabdus sp. SCSIO 66989]